MGVTATTAYDESRAKKKIEISVARSFLVAFQGFIGVGVAVIVPTFQSS